MSGWSGHFYALGSAASALLLIVVVVAVFLPLFVLIYIPHPKLIAEYQESLSKLQDLIFGLVAVVILSVVAGYVSSRLSHPNEQHKQHL